MSPEEREGTIKFLIKTYGGAFVKTVENVWEKCKEEKEK